MRFRVIERNGMSFSLRFGIRHNFLRLAVSFAGVLCDTVSQSGSTQVLWAEQGEICNGILGASQAGRRKNSSRVFEKELVSDATWYQNAGVLSILIGPGDYRVAHAVDEYIELKQLVPGMKICALAVMEWLGYK